MITAYTVSAFTANGNGGNKAGVVLEADELSDDQMLAITKELAYPETAFVSKSETATYKVRFFTITEEVDLCGHATIATWALLLKKSLINKGTYSQETLAGKLGIMVGDDGSVFMQQTEPKFLARVSIKEIAPILRIEEDSFEISLQPQIVSTGMKDLLVPIRNKDILMDLRPNFGEMSSLSKKYDITGLHVFTLDEEGTAIARNFAPLVGIDEESATGTSNGALLCYLKESGRLKQQDIYRIEQGESMGQLSNILGIFMGERVWIGGQANLLTEKQIEV